MRIGLLGGSFDPVHKGHMSIVEEAILQFDLDEFYFVPTGINPWKDNVYSSDKDRIEMLKIAIKKIKTDKKVGIELYEIEHNDQKNYTIDTLQYLTSKNPDNKYYYFIGYDQLEKFDRWKKAKKISELVQLVYFNRGGYSKKSDNIKKYNFLKMKHDAIFASSSEIREGQLNLTTRDVISYIAENGLYLETMIKDRMKSKRYKHTLSVASLAKEIAIANRLDGKKAYIAAMLHDVAKEMDHDKAQLLMRQFYKQYMDKPEAIWHQWLSAYIAEHDFFVCDPIILKAIEDHTTASTTISELGMCLYVADKLDPLRGYDSSLEIELCKKDIRKGFVSSLKSFYDFSTKKGRSIDPCFFDVYNKFVKGDNNG